MLFQFENLNTLKTLMLGGFIPLNIIQKSCRFGYDGETLIVSTEENMETGVRDRLRSLGVKGSRKSSLLTETAPTWIEIIPLTIETSEPDVHTTILFQMKREQMVSFVQDFVSQGHLSQQYAFFDDQVLCRAVDPPYYLVLKYTSKQDVTLYQEVPNSGVWVQRGFNHPLQTFFRVEKNMVLISEKEGWIHLPLLEWKEVFDYTNFTIGNESTLTKEEGVGKIDVPLTLIRGKSTKPDVFWVIRKDPIEQMETFLKNVSDSEVDQFSFSMVKGENPILLLKARNQNHPPTVLFDAESYMISSVPWLYLPSKTHINPPLRPGILSNLLFQEGQIAWLAPQDSGRQIPFKVERVEDTFLPLNQWVQYIISENEAPLTQWVESTIFEFDSFVDIGCEWKAKPKKKAQKEAPVLSDDPPPDDKAPFFTPSLQVTPIESTPIEIALPSLEVSEQEIQFKALTDSFLEMKEPWGDPSRVDKWIEIGNAYAGLKNEYQAILCWSRALWISPKPQEILASWETLLKTHYGFSDVHEILNKNEPSLMEVIFVCVWILRQEKIENLEAVQSFVQTHQKVLDQRLLWKVSFSLSKLSGGDKLLLASTYDTILENNSSISVRELPGFVRSQSNMSSLKFIQDTLESYLETYLSTKRDMSPQERTTISALNMESNLLVDSQVRMMFALAFARTGQRNRAMEEVEKAREVLLNLHSESSQHQRLFQRLIFDVFSEKVEEALNGEPMKDISSTLKEQIATQSDMHLYHWNALMKYLSLFPSPFGDNQNLWTITNDPNLGFKPNLVPFGKETENEITRLLNWAHSKVTSKTSGITTSQLKGVCFYLIYLCNSIESKMIPTFLDQVYKLIEDTSVNLHDVINPIIKICQRFDLKGKLSESISMASNHFDDPEVLKKMSEQKEYIGNLPEYASNVFLLGPELLNPSFDRERNQWSSYLQGRQIIISQLRQEVEDMRGNTPSSTEEEEKIKSRISIKEKKISEMEVGISPVLLILSFIESIKTNSEKDLISNLMQTFKLFQQTGNPNVLITLYKVLQLICIHGSPEIVSLITSNLMVRLPTTHDNFGTNTHTSLSVLGLMDRVIFSLVSDHLIFSDQVITWADEDEKLLFKGIQEAFRG